MNKLDEYKKSYWEMGECTDKSTIYLNIKSMGSTRFNHMHITKQDLELMVKDFQMLLNNNDDNLHYSIKRT